MTKTNIFADTIADNRYIAKAQLTKAIFESQEQWDEYTRVIDVLAISAWNSLNHKTDENLLGAALAGLFGFFGSEIKATAPMQRRFILSCVQVKREQSVAMKKARKALRNASDLLKEEELKEVKDETAIKVFKDKVEEAKAEVARLESEPNNVWYNKTPLLTTDRKHATDKCRKLIEDTMADVMAERDMMTAEELQEEAIQLKAARKARKQIKEQAKKDDATTMPTMNDIPAEELNK